MNFLKGIVDGILSEDVSESTNRPRWVESDDSEAPNTTESYSHRTKTARSVFINNAIEQLGHLYQSERDKCLENLVIRYGEGCVQQLSQMLKTNHETIMVLTEQLDNNIAALRDVNRKMESAAVQQVQLRNENDKLQSKVELLKADNMSLKSQLAQANITIKSKDSHIEKLNEIISDGKGTFESMKRRCGEFYRYKTEIDELKKKLELAEGHIEMLKQERDQFWNNVKVTDDLVKSRIASALERQDKAIAIAKLMASQPINMGSFFRSSEGDVKDGNFKESEQYSPKMNDEPIYELKSKVESLQDENAHLKEINDDLHTMYADLSKTCMDIKRKFLQESIDSLISFLPQRTTPIQLIFIQPTGVLDLEFDTRILSDVPKPAPVKQISTIDNSRVVHTQGFAGFTDNYTKSTDDGTKVLPTLSKDAVADKKSAAWDTDWDFFEDVGGQTNLDTTKEANCEEMGEPGGLDRDISSYESAIDYGDISVASINKLERIKESSEMNFSTDTMSEKLSINTLLVDLGSPVKGDPPNEHSAQEVKQSTDESPKVVPKKSNSPWDNIDFDDEMFNE